jgi:hypothetical protein
VSQRIAVRFRRRAEEFTLAGRIFFNRQFLPTTIRCRRSAVNILPIQPRVNLAYSASNIGRRSNCAHWHLICLSVCIVCIATIWSIDMSISGMTGTSASWQRLATTSTQSKSTTTDQAASATASSSGGTASPFVSTGDGIRVGLPNGMSVGVFHIAGSSGQEGGTSAGSGSDGSFSQMIGMVEQLVAAFENSPAATASTATQASTTDTSAGGTSASATSGSRSGTSVDGISVDMPNGFSVEVFHANQGNETSADSAATSDQMVNAMEQLVAALDQYPGPGAAAGAYSNVGANASSASTTAGSLNAVA